MADLGFTGELTCAISVTDFKRSARWYQDVLGFQQLYALDDMGWGEFATHIPGVTVGLGVQEEIPQEGGAVLTFSVKDAGATRAVLEAKGVRFEGPNQEIPGMVILATFLDPDGNHFMLAQTLQSPA
jgi:predicted enzyme related to lactoylglutathione lyase